MMLKFALPFVAFAVLEIMTLAGGGYIAAASERLEGSEWGVSGEDKPFIQFGANGRVSGNSGCNRFTGAYEVAEDGSIKIGPLASTRMACPEPAMASETKFFAMLDEVRSFERSGKRLALRDTNGAVLVELAQRDAD
jgi:heat shock protein HslJ